MIIVVNSLSGLVQAYQFNWLQKYEFWNCLTGRHIMISSLTTLDHRKSGQVKISGV